MNNLLIYPKEYELKMYRTALLLGVVIYAPIGYFYSDLMFQFENDGFVERLPYTFICFLGLILSYKFIIFNKFMRYYVLLCSLAITGHFQSMVEANNNHWLFITGCVQVPLIMTTIFYHKIDAVIYFFVCVLMGEYFLRTTPFYESSIPSLFYPALIGTYLLIYYFFLSYRKEMVETLQNVNKIIVDRNIKIEKLNNAATQAAHDIRSPVQALKVLSERLMADESARKIIYDSVSRIQYISETLLSEYKDINKESNSKSVNLYNVVTSAIDEKKSLYKNHDIMLDSKHKEGCIPSAWSHEIYRVISNILQNAIDASSETQKISVRLFEESDMITISIQDNGSGISKDHLDKVFDYGFTHGKTNGTGLGLAHAKEYIESIGGSITISSKVGKGTLVTIRMPIA